MPDYIKHDGKRGRVDVQLSVLIVQEEQFYVAYCPALNLSAYGDSPQDAKDAFNEILTDYIEEGARKGTLHKDLARLGWTFSRKRVRQPEDVSIDIPVGVLKKQYNTQYLIPAC